MWLEAALIKMYQNNLKKKSLFVKIELYKELIIIVHIFLTKTITTTLMKSVLMQFQSTPVVLLRRIVVFEQNLVSHLSISSDANFLINDNSIERKNARNTQRIDNHNPDILDEDNSNNIDEISTDAVPVNTSGASDKNCYIRAEFSNPSTSSDADLLISDDSMDRKIVPYSDSSDSETDIKKRRKRRKRIRKKSSDWKQEIDQRKREFGYPYKGKRMEEL
ncbi:uncharacterized protein LOC122508314 [Leptopilina heterotoma]|uniref:uncharacterized protein LOC122508314 n=1 Tax=Leptopilina heterotoma TaxID=63436 RepID=UPI001CA8D785|nr:uncharacterized protein LOC122508314 [Leptopilina heterotoma]